MRLTYEPLGKYVRLVDERNIGLTTETVLGINIDKYFMPSVANVIGTDLSNYKLLRKGRFACNPMHVGRDGILPVARYTDEAPAIVSPAYFMFEIIDENEIEPDYLMLCFRRPNFDRMCWFRTDASVRGGITWNDVCALTIPVPPLSEQQKIVWDYQIITDRIGLLRQVNEKLEEAEQTILLKTLSMEETIMTSLGDIAEFIDGDRGKNYPTFDEFFEEGYCLFLSAANVTFTGFDFENCVFVTEEKDKAMNKGHLHRYDIVLTSRGTLGNVAFYDGHVPYENVRINSGMLIIRPKRRDISPYFLYALLKSDYMRIEIEKFKSGSAQPQLPIRDLQKVSFPIPVDGQNLVSLSSKLRITQETISLYTHENDTLKRVQRNVLAKMSS